jgi:hypothetical protein
LRTVADLNANTRHDTSRRECDANGTKDFAEGERAMDRKWYEDNLLILKSAYSQAAVMHDDVQFTWVSIAPFALPPTVVPQYTTLLLTLKGIGSNDSCPLDGIYLNKGHRRPNGDAITHYFEAWPFSRLAHLNYASYCIHPKGWRPAPNLLDGDNLMYMVAEFYELIKEDK